MKFIGNTGILSDGSLINFLDQGIVIAYFSKEWKACAGNKFIFKSEKQAKKVFEELDKLLINQKNKL